MRLNIINKIKKKAQGLNTRIIFPEGSDKRIIKAAEYCAEKKICQPILITEENTSEKYAKTYSKKTGTPIKTSELIVKKPLFHAACALANGDADGMIGGCVYTSGEFIAVSKAIVGLQKGISVPSSFFVMTFPKREPLVYADCAVNPNPTPKELADIAITTARSVKTLLGWKPRVAMLSFSTRGSATHPEVNDVIKAEAITDKKARDLMIDGEFQADTALVLSTAKRKIKGRLGGVAGKANTLIFPDLDAGNIAYKLTQILAGANAYGPFLQGFNKVISDLSRGASVEDIIGTISVVSYWARRMK